MVARTMNHVKDSHFTRLEDSILVLLYISNQIGPALDSLKNYSKNKHFPDDELEYTVTNYLIILLVSFYDEWTIFNSLSRSNDSVKESCSLLKPFFQETKILKKIEKLKPYRNIFLAHAGRNDNKDRLNLATERSRINPTSNYAEKIYLAESVNHVILFILHRHKLETKSAIKKEKSRQIPPNENCRHLEITNLIDLQKAIDFNLNKLAKIDSSFEPIVKGCLERKSAKMNFDLDS